jgi:hypothetical protein
MPATSLAFEVMNATADDWESLEQIHPQVNEYRGMVEASVVAEEMMRLLSIGLFEVMPKAPSTVEAILAEPTEYWFRMTPAGRSKWQKQAEEFGFEMGEGPQA